MTNKKHKSKGKSVLARKPEDIYYVKETITVGNKNIEKFYKVKDFTSRSL